MERLIDLPKVTQLAKLAFELWQHACSTRGVLSPPPSHYSGERGKWLPVEDTCPLCALPPHLLHFTQVPTSW